MVHFSTQFFILDKAKALINLDKPEDKSNTMKSESREAKGHKSTGGRRTLYGKRETLTLNPVGPPPPPATINYIILSLTFDLKSEYTSILLLVWV